MIVIKTEKEIEAMRKGGKVLARIMEELGKNSLPGKNTWEIDALAEKLILEAGGTPVFKGYGSESGRPFPGTICASINHEIVHGIPSKNRILEIGDIFKIDVGMRYQGMITDMARTWPVGHVSAEAQKLLDVTRECLNVGIGKLRAKGQLAKYSGAVEEYVKKFGFSPVRDLVGHGVGRKLHEDPFIPNYKSREYDVKLKIGMTLALEPMINVGTCEMDLEKDGWTYVTRDGRLSAHFEDTVLITENGVEILTRI